MHFVKTELSTIAEHIKLNNRLRPIVGASLSPIYGRKHACKWIAYKAYLKTIDSINLDEMLTLTEEVLNGRSFVLFFSSNTRQSREMKT